MTKRVVILLSPRACHGVWQTTIQNAEIVARLGPGMRRGDSSVSFAAQNNTAAEVSSAAGFGRYNVSNYRETMNLPPPRTKQGFTLIELSIVLVIIGLIIGGILVGQDLIKSAETRAQLTQIERYNTAVNTFRNKYGGIPGDLALASANQFGFFTHGSCTGQAGGRDGNGLIDGWSGGSLAALMGENGLFWSDLTYSKLIDTNSSPSTNCVVSIDATATAVGAYLPAGKIGYGSYVHVYETQGANWFMLATNIAFSSATSNIASSAGIPVIQAYNLDKKIDDGLPTTGNVLAVYINGSKTGTTTPSHLASDSATTCYNTGGPAYSTSINNGSGPNCALSFKMQ